MAWSNQRKALYGHAHTKARRAAAARHRPTDLCARCAMPLGPMSPALHYDHDDLDKRRYIGFSHKTCNMRAATLQALQQQATHTGTTDIEW